MMATSINGTGPSIGTFDEVDASNVGARWEQWKARFMNLLIALDITGTKKQNRQTAMLLHYAGPRVFEIYSTYGDEGDDFKAVIAKLDDYFAANTNMEFEKFNFRLIKQEKTEKFDQFVTRLRMQANACDFRDKDGEIKSQIICGCYSAELRRRCLREEMELKEVMALGRSFEVSRNQAL
jgi:hypothetical protein